VAVLAEAKEKEIKSRDSNPFSKKPSHFSLVSYSDFFRIRIFRQNAVDVFGRHGHA